MSDLWKTSLYPPISKESDRSKEVADANVKTKSSSDYVVIDETRFKTNAFLIFSIACILVINPLLYLLIQHRIVSQTYTEYMLYIFVGGVLSAIVDSIVINTDIRDKIKDSLCAVVIWVVYFCMAFKRRSKPWWYGLLLTIAITVVDYIIAFVIVFLASSGGISSFDLVPSKVSVFDWMDSKFNDESDYVEPEEFVDE